MSISILATDLDGTLIPIDGDHQNEVDLSHLHRLLTDSDIRVAFATGRHFSSVMSAIEKYQLMAPEWILCDVGTRVFERNAAGELVDCLDFQETLKQRTDYHSIQDFAGYFSNWSCMTLQEPERQSEFKLSFYSHGISPQELAIEVDRCLQYHQLPYHTVASSDLHSDRGLIDLLPIGVNKSFAVHWLATRTNTPHAQILFCGDSGNDIAPLTDEFHAVVVGNAHEYVVKKVREHHQTQGTEARLFLASQRGTSGVLEGLRHFESLAKLDCP